MFLPKPLSCDIEAHTPVTPSGPLLGWGSWAILLEHADGLQPKRFAAERLLKGGSRADAHRLTAQLLAEKKRGVNRYGT